MTVPANDREILGPHAMRFGWGTKTFFGVLLLAVVVGLIVQVVGNAAAEDRATSDQIAGCRSAFSAELVSGPTALALKALGEQGSHSKAFSEAIDRLDPERFLELTTLSRKDPDRFLRVCRSDNPGG